jgi:hypothetical protein
MLNHIHFLNTLITPGHVIAIVLKGFYNFHTSEARTMVAQMWKSLLGSVWKGRFPPQVPWVIPWKSIIFFARIQFVWSGLVQNHVSLDKINYVEFVKRLCSKRKENEDFWCHQKTNNDPKVFIFQYQYAQESVNHLDYMTIKHQNNLPFKVSH